MGDYTDIHVASLGKCEQCGEIVCMKDMPIESMNSKWLCLKCKSELSHHAFGYDKSSSGAKKIRWIGPDGNWCNKEPEKEFQLGRWNVVPPRRLITFNPH